MINVTSDRSAALHVTIFAVTKVTTTLTSLPPPDLILYWHSFYNIEHSVDSCSISSIINPNCYCISLLFYPLVFSPFFLTPSQLLCYVNAMKNSFVNYQIKKIHIPALTCIINPVDFRVFVPF